MTVSQRQDVVRILEAAGESVTRGATTTTDLAYLAELGLHDSLQADEDVCVTCYDAQDVPAIEVICDNCCGLGHMRRQCPSAKKRRTHKYAVACLQAAIHKSESRPGAGKAGLRRVPPRGQKEPFRPFPRKFSGTARARSAVDDGDEEEPFGFEGLDLEDERPSTQEKESAGIARVVEPAEPAEEEVTRDEGREPLTMPTVFQTLFAEPEKVAVAVERAPLDAEPEKVALAVERAPLAEAVASDRVATPPAGKQRLWGGVMAAMLCVAAAMLPILHSLVEGGRLTVDTVSIAWQRAVAVVVAIVLGLTSTRFILWAMLPAVDAHALGIAGPLPFVPASPVGLHGLTPAGPVAVRRQLASGAPAPAWRPAVSPNRDTAFTGRDSLRTSMGVGYHGPTRPRQPDEIFLNFTVDSGATAYIISAADEWMLDEVTESEPVLNVEVADGVVLPVKKIGTINAGKPMTQGKLGLRVYAVSSDGAAGAPRYTEQAELVYPTLTRVLVVDGIKEGTRLMGVRPLIRDGISAYFNTDNGSRITNCLKLPNGTIAPFVADDKHYEIAFRGRGPDAEKYRDAQVIGRGDVGLATRDTGRTPSEVHASLMHICDRLVRKSHATMRGYDLATHSFDPTECRGCRLGKATRVARKKQTAPSRGGQRRPYGSQGEAEPSSTGYPFFGQRVDSDITVKLPKSWPHGYDCAMSLCDRHSGMISYYGMKGHDACQVTAALDAWKQRFGDKLRDGKIVRLHTDNDTSYEGPEAKAWASEMVTRVTKREPYEPNTNPVAERSLGVAKQAMNAALAHAGVDACLWPWALMQFENIRYYTATGSHPDFKSPYSVLSPEAGPADLSWAKPMFCDVTVVLIEKERDGKLGHYGVEGCYLGHDFVRGCPYVFLPAPFNRIVSREPSTWRPDSFTIAREIRADTVCSERSYTDTVRGTAPIPDLRARRGPRARVIVPAVAVPAAAPGHSGNSAQDKEGGGNLVPADKEGGKGAVAADKEGDKEAVAADQEGGQQSDQGGIEGVKRLSDEQFRREVAAMYRHEEEQTLVKAAPHLGEAAVEVVLYGNEKARQVVESSTTLKFNTVAEAQQSKLWPFIRDAMEKEIEGKLKNEFATVVEREPGMSVMKTRWVIDVHLNADASIKKVKTRLVGCGYSQREGIDYGDVFAPTLPTIALLIFLATVAEQDYETDQIDAVKAFTQAKVDRVLHCEMPVGFRLDGCVLRLNKCLEGIKQGSAQWFKLNSAAWHACGLESDPTEPNIYTHPTLRVMAGVFADDVAAAFDAKVKTEYLALRSAYSELVKVDVEGPSITRPIATFVGCEIARDRQGRTLKLTQKKYMRKLAERFAGQYTLNDLPYPASKEKRTKFENLAPGTDETTVDKPGYLAKLGSVGWPTCIIRPDCAYAYSKLCSLSNAPTKEAHDAVMHLIGYLINTADMGPTYGGRLKVPLGLQEMPEHFAEHGGLYGVTDSSFGKDARPHGGYVVMFMNAAVYWSSKAFKLMVPDSTAEAETAQSSRATKGVLAARNVLHCARRPIVGATYLLGDNKAMMEIVKKEGATQRTRYYERCTMFVKFAVLRLLIVTKLVPTKELIADIFTKAVDKDTFLLMRRHLLNLGGDETGQAVQSRVARLVTQLTGLVNHI